MPWCLKHCLVQGQHIYLSRGLLLGPTSGEEVAVVEQSHFSVEVEGAESEGFQVKDACLGQVLDHHCPLCGQVRS